MKLYIASSEIHVGKVQEDVWIRDAFISKGIPSEILALKNIVEISESLDVVILKSVWGYHLDYEEFITQISTLKKKNVRLINDYNFIVWNIDKHKYLNEIMRINVIPTRSLLIGHIQNDLEISALISEASKIFNATKLVVKPSISASGYLTHVYEIDGNNDAIIDLLKNNKNLGFIVQPYRASIIEGEISIIVINGILLYGVTRFPGILAEKISPIYLDLMDIPDLIKTSLYTLKDFFLKKFGILPAICRVDFLKNDSLYEISEVELIDPDLFFRHIPESVREEAISALLHYNDIL